MTAQPGAEGVLSPDLGAEGKRGRAPAAVDSPPGQESVRNGSGEAADRDDTDCIPGAGWPFLNSQCWARKAGLRVGHACMETQGWLLIS